MSNDLLVKFLADALVIPVVLLGSYALVFKIPKGKRLDAYKRILVAGLMTYLIAKLVGLVYQPAAERPFEALGLDAGASYLDNPGFPSDHVLFVMAITLAVWFETKHKLITGILLAMSLLIAIGRVLALVHTPLDVIGGAAIAVFGAIWYLNK